MRCITVATSVSDASVRALTDLARHLALGNRILIVNLGVPEKECTGVCRLGTCDSIKIYSPPTLSSVVSRSSPDLQASVYLGRPLLGIPQSNLLLATMAPSATETITVPQSVTSSLKAFATGGDYKEIAAVSFSEDTEKKGTDEHAAASVRIKSLSTLFPCLLTVSFSTPSTSPHGTRIRHTLLSSPSSTMTPVTTPTRHTQNFSAPARPSRI